MNGVGDGWFFYLVGRKVPCSTGMNWRWRWRVMRWKDVVRVGWGVVEELGTKDVRRGGILLIARGEGEQEWVRMRMVSLLSFCSSSSSPWCFDSVSDGGSTDSLLKRDEVTVWCIQNDVESEGKWVSGGRRKGAWKLPSAVQQNVCSRFHRSESSKLRPSKEKSGAFIYYTFGWVVEGWIGVE